MERANFLDGGDLYESGEDICQGQLNRLRHQAGQTFSSEAIEFVEPRPITSGWSVSSMTPAGTNFIRKL